MISVIMSIKNNQYSLENAIESILSQTYKNFEFLIIDDNSTDNSFEMLKNYELKDQRVKLFKNDETIGLTKSLNYLINHSKGLYLARQDGDDVSLSSRFQSQIKYLESQEYDFCISRATNMQNNEIIPNFSYYMPKKLVIKIKNPFIHGTLMIKKEVLLAAGGYDERFFYAQDYKLFTDLVKNNIKFKYIKTPLYSLNTINNISNNHKVEQRYYSDCVRKKILP
tara:strand:+ start:26761 stop:27432 length:672 start_codon:yes stop_codon:yes gene_type:complete